MGINCPHYLQSLVRDFNHQAEVRLTSTERKVRMIVGCVFARVTQIQLLLGRWSTNCVCMCLLFGSIQLSDVNFPGRLVYWWCKRLVLQTLGEQLRQALAGLVCPSFFSGDQVTSSRGRVFTLLLFPIRPGIDVDVGELRPPIRYRWPNKQIKH